MPLARLWALAVALVLLAPLAHAGLVPLTFSGNTNAPLTINIPQPITYTITSGPALPVFDFKAVGNIIGGSANVSGTLAYTINGGAPISLNIINTNTSQGSIATNDLVFFHNNNIATVNAGDIVVLTGSATTAINVSGPPGSGSYSAILVDPNGAQIGAGNVPEPASIGVLALAGITLLARRHFR